MALYRNGTRQVDAFRLGMDERPDWFVRRLNDGRILPFSALENAQENGISRHFCQIMTPRGEIYADFGDYVYITERDTVFALSPETFEKLFQGV